jgi:hypothetical protein
MCYKLGNIPTRSELDNLLVGQKNNIVKSIDDGEYHTALSKLSLVRGLWIECGYSYKWNELLERITTCGRHENISITSGEDWIQLEGDMFLDVFDTTIEC